MSKKEEVTLLPQEGHPRYSDETKITEEEQFPDSEAEACCDTTSWCEGFEPLKKEE